MSYLNQEQLQQLHAFEVLDFDQDDLHQSLEQQGQEESQRARTQVQAIPRNDQADAADPISLIHQFQEFNCKCHHETPPINPMKRPLPSSLIDQQTAKKLQLLESQGNNHCLHGFTRLALPMQQKRPTVSPPLRTASAPACSFNNYNHFLDAVSGSNANSNSPVSPQQVGVDPSTPSPVKGSPSVSRRAVDSGSVKPPIPPTIRRTVSDPSPISSGGISVGGNPLSERIRMMKHDLKLISRWCDQVIRGEEEERRTANEGKNNGIENHKTENETQEAVSVEVIGDCLSVHFNCPCGKGYEILLTGKNCYYKLV